MNLDTSRVTILVKGIGAGAFVKNMPWLLYPVAAFPGAIPMFMPKLLQSAVDRMDMYGSAAELGSMFMNEPVAASEYPTVENPAILKLSL